MTDRSRAVFRFHGALRLRGNSFRAQAAGRGLRGQGGGQGVEGQFLQLVAPSGVAGDGEHLRIGIQSLRHPAQGRARTLVPGKMPERRSALAQQPRQRRLGPGIGLGSLPGQARDQSLRLERHGQIHGLRHIRPAAGGGLDELPGLKDPRPIHALRPQLKAKLLHPGLRTPLVQPKQRQEAFKPARMPPRKQRVPVQVPVELAQDAVNRAFHPVLSAQIAIQDQRPAQDKGRPHVVTRPVEVRAGADPAIRLLARQNGIDIAMHPALQIAVLEQPGQRNEAAQPGGHASPARPFPADPAAVADIRAGLVQGPGKPLGLKHQLASQPARGLEFRCRKGDVCLRVKRLHGQRLLSCAAR